VALRINWLRALAGVPAWINLDETYNSKAQQAALMISANNAVSHTPPATWSCYTTDGAEAAGKSNLAIGSCGPESVLMYMQDFGSNNYAVGHRRWLLYPQTRFMGTGDIPENANGPASNALWIMDSYGSQPRPATREQYVAWPPPGYVPYQVVSARWSFSYPKADFTAATVSVSSNGVPMETTIEPVRTGYGENTLVWYLTGLNTSQATDWPRPSADVNWTVSIRNVQIGSVNHDFDYAVTVFDPGTAGPDTVLPDVTGSAYPVVGRPNSYSYTQVHGATGYQWMAARRVPWTIVEDAEVDRGDVVSKTSAGYQARVQWEGYGGSTAWHLAHTEPVDQWLLYNRIVLPGQKTILQYKSRLQWATATQQARAQVSVDAGKTWQDVDSQVGTDGIGVSWFETRSVSLASFADRPLLIRFLYHYSGESYYPQPDAGWYLDNITILDAEELVPELTGDVVSGNSFEFVLPGPGDWGLAVRAQVYGRYWLEWGRTKRVSVSSSEPVLRFTGAPNFAGTGVKLEFSASNAPSGMSFYLEMTSALGNTWTRVGSAKLEEIVPGERYSFTITATPTAPRFYRIVGE
ncbi:MAG: CAP domain-containing protein, partial [Verrucomicrobiia bacterium]